MGNPFRCERISSIGYVEVQMWFAGVAGISEHAQSVSGFDCCTGLNCQAARLEMGVNCVLPVADSDQNPIAGKRFASHFDRASVPRNILGNPILSSNYH